MKTKSRKTWAAVSPDEVDLWLREATKSGNTLLMRLRGDANKIGLKNRDGVIGYIPVVLPDSSSEPRWRL